LLFLPGLAALHRQRREFRLRLVAADDEHEDMLAARLVVGDVHEAPGHADRERDHVERREIHVLHRRAFVPLAAPAPTDGDERLVRVVVVHQRALARLCLAVAQVEALGDRNRGLGRRVLAHGRSGGRIVGHRRLEADHRVQLALAFRKRAVGQPAVGTLQLAEARDAFQHLLATHVSDISPVGHRRASSTDIIGAA
jgi:hypothetical protein